jgi:transcriptional regulator with XRE-family HTH domain
MSTIPTRTGLPDSHLPDYEQAGPTALRILVGSHLRRLREAGRITPEDAGAAIRASASKISRLELGRNGFKPRDIADLLTLYGVNDGTERATLLTLAQQASLPGWWHTYNDLVPAWFGPYLGLEQAASVIRGYEVQFVPGLLQTEDYARAVIRLGHDSAGESELERRVSLRMRRQGILHGPNPPHLWVVIDEGALRRPIGGRAVMRAQIRHLIDIAELPRVTVEMLPFSAGSHTATGGPITILRFPEDAIRDVVYLEQLTSAFYPDRQADIDHYWHVMNRLVTEAESPAATETVLHWLGKEI